jgi:hypothetical protein
MHLVKLSLTKTCGIGCSKGLQRWEESGFELMLWQAGKKIAITKQVHNAAQKAAQRGGVDKDVGYRPGSVSRSMVKGGVAQRFPAAGQILVIRPYVKKAMYRNEDRISFNIFDEGTRTYAHKYFAFTTSLLSSELHKGNGHRVRFNCEPKYPQVLERIEGVELPKPIRAKRTGRSVQAQDS